MDFLAAMRIYVRVVERGSMSAASRDLGIGQPAVSERIEHLETRLGVRLLRRNTRAISVTDTGAIFYERCKLAIEAADDALAASRDDTLLRGTLRIAAPHGIGEVALPPILLSLRERHPQLKIDLVLNDRIVDPVTEGVDLSLRLGEVRDGSYIARPLGHVRRLLVASPAYLDRHGAPKEPGDLAKHPFARVSGLFNTGKLPLLSTRQRTISAPINIELSVSHWRSLAALLVGGAGLGVLQEPVCSEQLADGSLIRLLPEFTVPGFALHALYPAARPVPPRTRTVLSLLEELLPPILATTTRHVS